MGRPFTGFLIHLAMKKYDEKYGNTENVNYIENKENIQTKYKERGNEIHPSFF